MALCISHPFSSETTHELSKLKKTSTKVSPVPTAILFNILWCPWHQRPKTWACGRSPGACLIFVSPLGFKGYILRCQRSYSGFAQLFANSEFGQITF